MSLATRIPTALIIIAITILGIIKGGTFFFTGISVVSLLCLHEILKMKNLYFSKLYTFNLYLLTITFLFLTQVKSVNFWDSYIIFLCSIFLVILSCLEVAIKKTFSPKSRYFQGLISVCKLGLTLPFFILIRNSPYGVILTFFFIIVVATVDSSSYFSGKFLGKRKLSSISPNKTFEGSLGGSLTTLITAILIINLLNLNIVQYLFLTLIIIILAIIGDLHESLQKRKFKIKDTSSLLPGHGGIYDRVDSYILALPVTYYYSLIFLS